MKILIIDDESLITKLLKYCLENEGHFITIKNDGVNGLKEVRKNKYDIIFLDIAMPDINGLDILRIIKNDRSLKNQKVVMLSAFSNYKAEAFELGCDDFITKPFTASIILDAIEKLILKNNDFKI